MKSFQTSYGHTEQQFEGQRVRPPFSMIYGAEAVIPIEVSLSSIKVADFTRSSNHEHMVEGLDALEEKQEMVAVRLVDYWQKLAQGYNRKVRP